MAPWTPIIIRGSLWVSISMLTYLQEAFHRFTPEVLAHITWVDIANVAIGTALSGMIALRLFLDQSLARHSDKLAGTGNTALLTKLG